MVKRKSSIVAWKLTYVALQVPSKNSGSSGCHGQNISTTQATIPLLAWLPLKLFMGDLQQPFICMCTATQWWHKSSTPYEAEMRFFERWKTIWLLPNTGWKWMQIAIVVSWSLRLVTLYIFGCSHFDNYLCELREIWSYLHVFTDLTK